MRHQSVQDVSGASQFLRPINELMRSPRVGYNAREERVEMAVTNPFMGSVAGAGILWPQGGGYPDRAGLASSRLNGQHGNGFCPPKVRVFARLGLDNIILLCLGFPPVGRRRTGGIQEETRRQRKRIRVRHDRP